MIIRMVSGAADVGMIKLVMRVLSFEGSLERKKTPMILKVVFLG